MAKSPYETYSDWEKRTFCDNASRRGTGIGVTQCLDGKREFVCTATYNEIESDTMVLCAECKERLKKDAGKHGYKFQSKPLFFSGCELSKPSKCLQLLLSRTQRMRTWHPLRRTEPSEHQRALLDRMETRRWVKWSYENTLMLIRDLAGEIKFIKHAENCGTCLAELQLDVERYYGSRTLWYLDLQNEEFYLEDWRCKHMPYVGDYKIGSYWTGCSPDTIRFIKDRFKWAERITRKELMAAVKFLKIIMSWDIDWEPPFFGVKTWEDLTIREC